MTTKIRVAASGAGGGVGQSIIKSLYDSEYEVVSLDADRLAAGLYATAISYLIPYANDPSFVDRVLEVCEKEDCRLLFPGLDVELPILTLMVDRFAEIGTRIVVSTPDVIKLSICN